MDSSSSAAHKVVVSQLTDVDWLLFVMSSRLNALFVVSCCCEHVQSKCKQIRVEMTRRKSKIETPRRRRRRRRRQTHCLGQWNRRERRRHWAESATGRHRAGPTSSPCSICRLCGIRRFRWADDLSGCGWARPALFSCVRFWWYYCCCYSRRTAGMMRLDFRALGRRPPAACLVRNSPPTSRTGKQFKQKNIY